jgi:hypothetical protein
MMIQGGHISTHASVSSVVLDNDFTTPELALRKIPLRRRQLILGLKVGG